ncbi:hypothetical protein D1864_12505 [Oceanobacillus picturae]|nr:hypothetical protein D1864_12505 [Oceanobacillus picturae]
MMSGQRRNKLNFNQTRGMRMHRFVRVMVRFFTILYLLFLLVSQVHSPTSAFFTATSTVEGAVTAGTYAEEAPIVGEEQHAEEHTQKDDTTQAETDKGSTLEGKNIDEQLEDHTSETSEKNTEKEAEESNMENEKPVEEEEDESETTESGTVEEDAMSEGEENENDIKNDE